MKSSLSFSLLLMIALFLSSCGDVLEMPANETDRARLIVRLTDAPADYQEVNVEIIGLKVHSLEEGWIEFDEFQGGIYDLLELQDGIETVLLDTEILTGSISELRLILGEENTVLLNDEVFPLRTPGAHHSGLAQGPRGALE